MSWPRSVIQLADEHERALDRWKAFHEDQLREAWGWFRVACVIAFVGWAFALYAVTRVMP